MSEEIETLREVAGELGAVEGELTLDDLFNQGVDEAAVAQAGRELLLPVGTYTTTPPFGPKITKDKKGRPIVRFWGSVVFGDVTGKIGYSLSHVRKNGTVWVDGVDTGEDSGKPDILYKNYVQANAAFKTAYGREPTNVGELVVYLRDYPHRLRIIQNSRSENQVVAISAVRPTTCA